MHVLVTGATGFVGFHTVLALLNAGHSVRLGVRSVDKMIAVFGPHGLTELEYALGDITDPAAMQSALEGCDALVHTAAIVSLNADMAKQVYNTNVNGTRQVIGAALAMGIRSIVHVSSVTAMFNPKLPEITADSPLTDLSSPYGKSKVDSDSYLHGLIKNGAPIAITYPSAIMGPDDPALSSSNSLLKQFLAQGIPSTSSGLQIIDVRDLAAVHVKLLEQDKTASFIVAGHYLPWPELAALLEKVSHRKLRRISMPGKLMRSVGRVMDIVCKIKQFNTLITYELMAYLTLWVYCDDQKTRTQLKIEYRPSVETLSDTVRWLAENGHIKRVETK